MKSKTLGSVAAGALILTSHAVAADTKIENLYVFGDSMSDQRMFTEFSKANFGDFENAFQGDGVSGRRSNGKNWVDYLSETTGIANDLNNNFATVGALTSENNDFLGRANHADGNPIGINWNRTGVLSQIEYAKTNNIQFEGDDLVSLWGAMGNDFLSLMTDPSPDNAWKEFGTGDNQVTDEAVSERLAASNENYELALNGLKELGARNVLVMTWPDMASVPFFGGQSDEWKAKTSEIWQAYRTDYVAMIEGWAEANTDVDVTFVDMAAAYDVILSDLDAFGFTSLQGCYNGSEVCETPDAHFYWDILHPTTRTNGLIGSVVAQCLTGDVKDYAFDRDFCL